VSRARYSDHDRNTFDAAIATAKALAEKHLLPIRQRVDLHGPEFKDGSVALMPEVREAYKAVVESGLAAATADYDVGGMQLPAAVAACADAYLRVAGLSIVSYVALIVGNANLIVAHGSEEQKKTLGGAPTHRAIRRHDGVNRAGCGLGFIRSHKLCA
jgi:butyryl-CoA dehydrogenase